MGMAVRVKAYYVAHMQVSCWSIQLSMATGGDTPMELIQRFCTCPICLEELRNAKALPCLHTFCLQCLNDYWNDKAVGQNVVCPTCRNTLCIPANGLDDLPTNYIVQSLVEAFRNIVDGSHSEEHLGDQHAELQLAGKSS